MSHITTKLMLEIRAYGLPQPEFEYRFHPVRKWRFDLCWADRMVAAELEGGIWTGGRHTRGKGFLGDCEKYNAAAEMGWRVFRYPVDLVNSGDALRQLARVLA